MGVDCEVNKLSAVSNQLSAMRKLIACVAGKLIIIIIINEILKVIALK